MKSHKRRQRYAYLAMTITTAMVSSILVLIGGCKTGSGADGAAKEAIDTLRRNFSNAAPIQGGKEAERVFTGRFNHPGVLLVQRTGLPSTSQMIELRFDKTYHYQILAHGHEMGGDKGRWTWNGRLITLSSDVGTNRFAPLNKTYIPLQYAGLARKILLMGLEWDFPRFKEALSGDSGPDFYLLLHTFELEEQSPEIPGP